MQLFSYLGNVGPASRWISEDGWSLQIRPYFDLERNRMWLYCPQQSINEDEIGDIDIDEEWFEVSEVQHGYGPTDYWVESAEVKPTGQLLPIGATGVTNNQLEMGNNE